MASILSSPSTPPHSPEQLSPIDTKMAAPHWVIHRGNGHFVPLVAVDELPQSIQLQEAPRVMLARDVKGREMECLAEITSTNIKYTLVPAPSISPKPLSAFVDSAVNFRSNNQPFPRYVDSYAANNENAMSPFNRPTSTGSRDFGPVGRGYPSSAAAATITTKTSSMSESKWNVKDDSSDDGPKAPTPVSRPSRAASANNVGPTSRPLPPSGAEPDDGKKRYCTFWIRNGECDYTQQGCLYLHDMPDQATLATIGFRDVPKWWREKLRVAEKAKERQILAASSKPDWRARPGSSGSTRGPSRSASSTPSKLGKSVVTAGPKAPGSNGGNKYKAPQARSGNLGDEHVRNLFNEHLIDLGLPLIPVRAHGHSHEPSLSSDSSPLARMVVSPILSSASTSSGTASGSSSAKGVANTASPTSVHPPRFTKSVSPPSGGGRMKAVSTHHGVHNVATSSVSSVEDDDEDDDAATASSAAAGRSAQASAGRKGGRARDARHRNRGPGGSKKKGGAVAK